MKTLLLMCVALLMTASAVRADRIGVYTDATGNSCNLSPGFTTSATVVHRFTSGATSSRFKLEFPAGSNYFSFNTPYTLTGSILSDASVHYGQCLTGLFAVGTIVAILATGELWVRPASGYSSVIVWDCAFLQKDATCGGANVGFQYDCPNCLFVATDQKTWGAVKSLYRE